MSTLRHRQRAGVDNSAAPTVKVHIVGNAAFRQSQKPGVVNCPSKKLCLIIANRAADRRAFAATGEQRLREALFQMTSIL